MMAIPATSVRFAVKVRTPRAPREVKDTVEVLYAKVLEVVNHFEKESDKVRARKNGQSIVDLQSGDTQPNRRAMRDLLRMARKWVEQEAVKAQAQVEDKARFVELVARIANAWEEAQDAWLQRATGLSVDGHKGHLAVAKAPFEGKPMFIVFASLEARIERMSSKSNDSVEGLLKELDAVTQAVLAFQHTTWCVGCGTPTEEIMPRNGKPAFVPKLCGSCFRSQPAGDVVSEAKPAKHRVAKPGSASKRHKGGVKKVKGKLSAKDEAKNAKLLAEVAGVTHQDKPNTRQPAKAKKVGTKTKTKKQGLGS